LKYIKILAYSIIPIFLSINSVFLVTDIDLNSFLIGLSILTFAILIPGFVVGNLNFSQNTITSEKIILGTTAVLGFALLVHPIFGKFGVANYTWIVFLILSLFFIIKDKFNLNNFSSFNFWVLFLILLPVGIWIGRQADVVPIKNFDAYSIPPDIYHHLSIAAEIGNHGPEIFPYIAASNVFLQYHWGAFSLGSFLSAGNLISLPIAMYRFEFILLSFLLLFLLFYTGKYLDKSNISGIVTSIFGFFTLVPSFNIVDGLQVPNVRTGSISQLASSVFLVAGLRVFFEILNAKNINKIHLFILTTLVMATTLSKGPTGLILLGIISLTSIILFFKRNKLYSFKLALGPLIGFGIILPLIFSFGTTKSSGMTLWLSPLASAKTVLGYYGESINSLNTLKISLILITSTTTYLLIIFLNWRKRSITYLPILTGIIVSTLGLFLLEAWGNSQWFVYYPVGILVSLLLAEITPQIIKMFNNYELVIYIFLGAIFQNTFFLLLRNWFDPNTLNLGILWVFSVVFTGILSYLIAFNYWKHKFFKSINAVALSILFVGSFSALQFKDIYPYPVSNYEHPWSITIGTAAAAEYLKNNSNANEVLVTNRHCVGQEEKNTCIARVFSLTALSERRTFIEGWAYTTCPLREALNNEYWNQPLLKLNQNVVEKSDMESAKKITEYGVRWIVIDQRRPHASDLSNIAEKKFQSGQVQVWKIKNELISSAKPTYMGCKSA
jgi:hypothetical protein